MLTVNIIENEDGLLPTKQISKSKTRGAKKMEDPITITPVNEALVDLKMSPMKMTKKQQGKIIERERIKENLFDTNLVEESNDSQPDKISSRLNIDPKVDKVYKLIKKSTGALGGNGYDGAIYGELTMHSMQRVLNIMVEKCEMDHTSRFIDVGSGLGKPNFHAAQSPGVRLSLGVELEEIRWQLSMHNLHHIAPDMGAPQKCRIGAEDDEIKLLSNVNFICMDIDQACSTDPFTHIYMYDLGFPPPLQQSIARKFNNSVHARYLVSYRPPHRVIHEYGYQVEFVDKYSTRMHGSGEMHTAYFYKRINQPAKISSKATMLALPARPFFEEESLNVVCDPAFLSAAQLAVGSIEQLQTHASSIAFEQMEKERPKRERKPRQFYQF